MRKKSSKNRHHRHHVKVLKSEVMSPRIAWFNFVDFLKLLAKVTIILIVLVAIGFGVKKAIEYTFQKNPDFRLQAINLNQNDVIDESGLVERLQINLAANIFDFDVDLMEQKLLEIPAISEAHVERELPGTLAFNITTRKPLAWIASPNEGLLASRQINQLLVDPDNFVYTCPDYQLTQADQLPIIILNPDPDHPVVSSSAISHPEYRRCTQLLNSFRAVFPNDISMIESITQVNPWSLDLKTRSGTVATFGLDDHSRQLDYFSKALRHAQKKGYQIKTINLIPKQNVPITVLDGDVPPRAIPVSELNLSNDNQSGRNKDLRSLLNRN